MSLLFPRQLKKLGFHCMSFIQVLQLRYLPKGQSSPGILQSGQQPSNAIRQIPQFSSLATQRHVATPIHLKDQNIVCKTWVGKMFHWLHSLQGIKIEHVTSITSVREWLLLIGVPTSTNKVYFYFIYISYIINKVYSAGYKKVSLGWNHDKSIKIIKQL